MKALFATCEHKIFRFVFGGLFNCSGYTLISVLLICNGKQDCPGDDPSDEEGCICNKSSDHTKKCKYFANNAQKQCSTFYYFSRTRTCEFFVNLPTQDQGRNIRQNLLTNTTTEECISFGKLSCTSENICYNTAHICRFLLDEQSSLFPCKHGDHIQNCTNFDCNAMLKCPRYYCVPWWYTCNGRWDCPAGYDELSTECQKERRHCQFLFKCTSSQICVHFLDICDGTADCPYQDDEHVCSTKSIKCPPECECLLFAIKCVNVEISEQTFYVVSQYHVIVIIKSHVNVFFTTERPILLLTLTKSSGVSICLMMKVIKGLIKVQVTKSSLTTLRKRCFYQSDMLKVTQLEENQISSIESQVFPKLGNLSFLNLSQNPLLLLESHVFSSLSQVTILSLNIFQLEHVAQNAFGNITLFVIDTKNILLCCLKPVSTKCTSFIPWFVSCFRILQTSGTPAAFLSCFFIITAVNMASVVCQKNTNVSAKRNAYDVSVASITVLDTVDSLYFLTIWVTDQVFKGNYIQKDAFWRSSLWCFTINALFQNYTLLSPALMVFLSVSRLLVVLYPMKSQFKMPKYAFKYISIIVLFSVLLSVLFSLLFWGIEGEVPNSLCISLIDHSDAVVTTQVLVWLTAVWHIFALVSVIAIYSVLIVELQKSQETTKASQSKEHSNKALVAQVVVITITAALCWVPTGIVYIVALLREVYMTEMIPWTLATSASLNSVVSPSVFIVINMRKQMAAS